MSYFCPGDGGEYGIRLSVSHQSEEKTTAGILRLARSVAAETEK